MIEDHIRTGKYYEAIMGNQRQFQGKVVLDVGAGSGLLSIFAAKAGAKKVYAVEATDVAKMAKVLVEHNKVNHIVEVIQGTCETINLPEKVDIIVSEWMGYFLLRESMLDTVLDARDRFLKPGGSLYPSHARLMLMPFHTKLLEHKKKEYMNAMYSWSGFVKDCQEQYDLDFTCLERQYQEEHVEYFLGTCFFQECRLEDALGPGVTFKKFDLNKCSLEEIQAAISSHVELPLLGSQYEEVNALAGYFEVDFSGSDENPADLHITLTTAPSQEAMLTTHWGQQLMLLAEQPESNGFKFQKGNRLHVDIEMERRKDFKRHLTIRLKARVEGEVYGRQQPKALVYQLT